MTTSPLTWREVSLTRPYDEEAIHSILNHFSALSSRGPLIWEIRCKNGKIRYLFGTREKSIKRVEEVIGAQIKSTFKESVSREEVNSAFKLRITKSLLSMNTDVSLAMLRAVFATLSKAKNEEIVVQLVVGASFAPTTIPKNISTPASSWLSSIIGASRPASREEIKEASKKASLFKLDCLVRIGSSNAKTTTRLWNLISAFRTLESAGVHITAVKENPAHLNSCQIPWRFPMRLSVREVACFMLLPVGEEEYPGTKGLHPKPLDPPDWYRSSETFNRNFCISQEPTPRLLGIPARDALEHTVVLGPTGSGKSTVLKHLILADIEAGRSVLVVDPKYSLVHEIMECIPEHRKEDVVVIDPSDDAPTGFNPLALGSDPVLTADSILSVFRELWSSSWGVRTQDILSGALLTLAKTKGANLLWLPQLLMDENFRESIVSKIHDPLSLEPFWRHFDSLRPSERNTEIAPSLNKLRQLTYRKGLRNILGQSDPKFSLADLFSKRKIVLVPLNRGLIGADSAKLLGSLIVGLTWTLALSRASEDLRKKPMVSIFIDELQDYVSLPNSFSDALSQARGLKVSFTVAHQYRDQLPPDIKAGIDANCKNKIIFGLSSADAKDLKNEAPELSYEDFMLLPRYSVYTKLLMKGRSTGWISATTLPPPEKKREASEVKMISSSRYGVPSAVTEAELIRMLERPTSDTSPTVIEAPIGRKKKEPHGKE